MLCGSLQILRPGISFRKCHRKKAVVEKERGRNRMTEVLPNQLCPNYLLHYESFRRFTQYPRIFFPPFLNLLNHNPSFRPWNISCRNAEAPQRHTRSVGVEFQKNLYRALNGTRNPNISLLWFAKTEQNKKCSSNVFICWNQSRQ